MPSYPHFRLPLIFTTVTALCSPLVPAEEPELMAYVGTYTSPLQNLRPDQVDLPPGNGKGIHLFRVIGETAG